MKSCGEMMFNTDMFTNVKNEYEWVSKEHPSIGIFSIADFLNCSSYFKFLKIFIHAASFFNIFVLRFDWEISERCWNRNKSNFVLD